MSTKRPKPELSAHFIREKRILKAADTAKYNARLKEIDLPDDYAVYGYEPSKGGIPAAYWCVNKVLANARNAIHAIWRMRLPACRNPADALLQSGNPARGKETYLRNSPGNALFAPHTLALL